MHSRPIFLVHGRTCTLSHTRKYRHAWDGWTFLYSGLQESPSATEEFLCLARAAGRLCLPASPPSAADVHLHDGSSSGCMSGSSAVLRGVGFLEPLLQALATGWIRLILVPAGSLPRKACEELRGDV